jgi:pimeloyl-ACP methyl ester carboxylesterase
MDQTVSLAFREEGSGPPLLILHGLFGSASNWARHARALAADLRVFSVDLRNHGRSPHVARMDYPAMAADLGALLDRLELPAVRLLGHSMGGKAAMMLALAHPERVARLLVVDIAPRRYRGQQARVMAALQALDLDTLGSRGEADARLAASLPEPGLRAFLLTNLVQHGDGYAWRINLPAISAAIADLEDFPAGPERYTGPTRFVAGAVSDYLRPADETAIRARFPAAEFDYVAKAGHWVHAEQPAAFFAAVHPFLVAAA